jgi:hypothetical protein
VADDDSEWDPCECDAWECTVYGTTAWHRCANGCPDSWKYGDRPEDKNCARCHPEVVDGWVTKDSGKREEYDSGMVRDTQEGKPRYDLLVPSGVPYAHQFLTRVANLLARGAEKYSDRNWEQAAGSAELDRFQSSALRHLMQWVTGETDEDHAAAVVFNLLAYETIKWKLDNGSD